MPITREQREAIYQQLGIESNDLGCIMLNTEPIKVSDVVSEEELYYSLDQHNHKYTQGIVSESVPHITLLFGLMESGQYWKKQVEAALEGWELPEVEIESVSHFESSDPKEPYYCVIAKLVVSPELKEGNTRMRILPHIDTFPDYLPHITLAYIKQDEDILSEVELLLNSRLAGKKMKVVGVNYGD